MQNASTHNRKLGSFGFLLNSCNIPNNTLSESVYILVCKIQTHTVCVFQSKICSKIEAMQSVVSAISHGECECVPFFLSFTPKRKRVNCAE